MLKSFARDFEYVQNLLQSYEKYNIDKIPIHIVIPRSDFDLFSTFANDFTIILCDEDIPVKYASEYVGNIRPGYINQQIVKLTFWKLNISEHYFCLDSETVFLRDFTYSDFMTPEGEPYIFLTDDNDLQTDPDYFLKYWKTRQASLAKIRHEIGITEEMHLKTSHNSQTFSKKVLQDFEVNFLESKELDYIGLLAISPYEFSWYNYYLQFRFPEALVKDPVVKMFHSMGQLAYSRLLGISKKDLSKGYIAIIVNSNFHGYGLDYNYKLYKLIAKQVPSLLLLQALLHQCTIQAFITWRHKLIRTLRKVRNVRFASHN